ncbi:SHOCT domain-containing protein [Psychromonas sp.]|uniref:SHOCT domain-containing protein n=1 Tax=Psychromonas sp. TaxID=1884585 RepID=UPI0035675F80
MMLWYPDMMGWGGGIGMIVFWIIIIVVIVVLVKYMTTQSPGRIERKETPIEIIKRRYANGEIDKEEYEQKKKDLEA